MAITKHNFIRGGLISASDFNQLENEVDTALEEKQNKLTETQLANLLINHNDYAKTTDLPTKVSQLDNDLGYLTEHQDLSDYATKNDLTPPTNEEIDAITRNDEVVV